MLLCIILVIFPVGAINDNSNWVHCNKVSITGFRTQYSTGTMPVKIGFLGSFTDSL